MISWQVIKIFFEKDLFQRIKFTLLILFFYRLFSYLPLPMMDIEQINIVSASVQNSFLAVLDEFSGGAMTRMSVMAFNIQPYIQCSILFQVGSTAFPFLIELKKQGQIGRDKIGEYTKYTALIYAFVQGYLLAAGLEYHKQLREVVIFPGFGFQILTAFILAATTMISIWLSDQLNTKGLGGGTSLLIYAGILSGAPLAISRLYNSYLKAEISNFYLSKILVIIFVLFLIIVYFERAYRFIQANYSGVQKGLNIKQPQIPIKVNPAGIYPVIFAGVYLAIPYQLGHYVRLDEYSWGVVLLEHLKNGNTLHTILFALFIFITSYIYAEITFLPKEKADDLQRSGILITNCRPGIKTKEYLEFVLKRVATIGGIYLVVISVIPQFFVDRSILYISGTSFLIVIGVAMDFVDRVQSAIFEKQYKGLFKTGAGGFR